MVFNITSGGVEASYGVRRKSVEMKMNDTQGVDRRGQMVRYRESWKRRGGDRRFGD